MRVIKETLKNILLVGILASFLMSTSGFVVTRHICSHHSTEIVLGEVTDGCCEVEKIETIKTSCCSAENISSNEKSDECCQFEQTYIRLSENFISSERPDFRKEIQVFSNCTLNEFIPTADEVTLPVKETIYFSQEKIPKAKIYLHFHQIKVEPPLV